MANRGQRFVGEDGGKQRKIGQVPEYWVFREQADCILYIGKKET
jgi:hypothetical protein